MTHQSIARPGVRPFAPILAILAAAALLLSLFALVAPVSAASGDVEEANGNLNSCQTNEGDETTTKNVTGGSLTQGGDATFTVTYEPIGNAQQADDEFTITDCLFIGETAVAAWDVTAVKGDGVVTFTVTLPTAEELAELEEEEGDLTSATEYCNYVSLQGNAGDAFTCFVLAGDATIWKTDAATDAPLAGAEFTIDCTPPATETEGAFIPFSVTAASFDEGTGTATTGADGKISVHTAIGSECTFTETKAPAGYSMGSPADATLTVDWTEVSWTFVNTAIPASSAPASSAPASAGQQGGGASTAPNTALFETVPGGPAAVVVAGGILLGSIVSLVLMGRASGWRRFND